MQNSLLDLCIDSNEDLKLLMLLWTSSGVCQARLIVYFLLQTKSFHPVQPPPTRKLWFVLYRRYKDPIAKRAQSRPDEIHLPRRCYN